jgi:8-oxo-dGTP pyrophosphatase MutT (NUDIX family)
MLSDNIIIPVRRTMLIHSAEPHPFHLDNEEEARRNWEDEIRRQPFLFDGQVALASDAVASDGCFTATCHLVPYSTFLYWRRIRPVPGALHVFAMALPVSSDGAVIAVRMGNRTANAGRVYCASGAFDRDDLIDGHFDPAVNMRREVMEETGLDLDDAVPEGGYHLLPIGGVIVIFRIFRFAADAETLAGKIAAHARAEADPEIAGAEILRRPDDITDAFQFHMPPVLNWYFSAGGRLLPGDRASDS